MNLLLIPYFLLVRILNSFHMYEYAKWVIYTWKLYYLDYFIDCIENRNEFLRKSFKFSSFFFYSFIFPLWRVNKNEKKLPVGLKFWTIHFFSKEKFVTNKYFRKIVINASRGVNFKIKCPKGKAKLVWAWRLTYPNRGINAQTQGNISSKLFGS